MNVYKKQTTNRQKQIQYLNVINIATFLRCPASEYPPFARRERSPRTADRFVLPQCRMVKLQEHSSGGRIYKATRYYDILAI